jgi:hypothetical protein
MGECVMSLYGIARLLRSRELGPSQLRPTLDAFGVSAKEHCVAMGPLFVELDQAAAGTPRLRRAVAELQRTAAGVASTVLSSFETTPKLGARQRLELERSADALGAELEAVRRLATALYAALAPRAVVMTLGDLLEARWQVAPTFVSHSITLNLAKAPQARFQGEPLVLRLLVEHALANVSGDGMPVPSACAREAHAGSRIIVGDPPEGFEAGEQVQLPLGLALQAEPAIVNELAKHLGVELIRGDGQVQLWIPG